MKLEEIGFYTLSDYRCKNASVKSPLWRNELIITAKCNFNCPYCRGTKINNEHKNMSFADIKKVIDLWSDADIKNIRLSGGEPTMHPDIESIVKYITSTAKSIEHIAISTNGYNDLELYKHLIDYGVNDYSISLDACCSSVGDMMSGGIKGSWGKVVENIKELSKLTYVTVGMVFDNKNSSQIKESIEYADSLGVADIRIVSSAQWNRKDVFSNIRIDKEILNRHPILEYRINNYKNNRNVRGIQQHDANKCYLMLDDMIVKGNYHYPCVIHMRENENPIGTIDNKTIEEIRKERAEYLNNHNSYTDSVCKKNCLDVCIDYNNKSKYFKEPKNV